MTQIINCAQNPIRKNLMAYQEKFAGLIAQIDKVNKMNKNIITFSLTPINNTMSYIYSLTHLHPHYSPSGQIKAGKLQGKLISQAG
jgi:flagellar biosynthesis/type III secretory pathway chaperone